MPAQGRNVCEGWLLKKKRRKMQGYAKRYAFLSENGVLSYSLGPEAPIRDSIFVNLAFVHATKSQRVFHVDSGNNTFHLKALSKADFETWTTALKGFVGEVGELKHSPRLMPVDENGGGGDTKIDLKGPMKAVTDMSATLKELEKIYDDMRTGESSAGHSPKLKFLGVKVSVDRTRGQSPEKTSPGGHDDYFDSKPSSSSVRALGDALKSLRGQHDKLLETLKVAAGVSQPPLPSEPWSPASRYSSRSTTNTQWYPARAMSRNSTAFSISSGDTEGDYEDARQWGEFVMQDEDDGEMSEEPESSSDLRESESEGDDSFTSVEEVEDDAATTKSASGGAVERRSQLPAPISGDEFSLIGLLRKNVGKDLSTISFPVSINEPLSTLQRIAEELEYSHILDRAAKCSDSIERLTLVTTWAISACSGNKYRSVRKPFNPLLGETFECVRPDKGFKFVSEKVGHAPNEMAFFAQGRGWKLHGSIAPAQKFWGRSMEISADGPYEVTFEEAGETYTIKKPSSFVRNLVAGTKYLEQVGDLLVNNVDTGESATIQFKEGSSWGGASSRNKIEGKICDSNGGTVETLAGRWDEHVDKKTGGSDFSRLWEINEFPPQAAKYYGFSRFGVELNEISELDESAAPTDSRFRPDQRAMEDGDVDTAEATKKKLEEKQRARRREYEAKGKQIEPQFFTKGQDGLWSYNGSYFEKREKKDWSSLDIFTV